jgi:hypothetical protein
MLTCAVRACWTSFMLAGLSAYSLEMETLYMLAGLCTCWLDFVHAGSAFYMLAGLIARWLDFVHAGWTFRMLTGLSCMLAGLFALSACWLHFVHAR